MRLSTSQPTEEEAHMKYVLLEIILCTALALNTAAMAQQPAASTQQAAPGPLKSLMAPPVGRDPYESRATMGPRAHDGTTIRTASRLHKHSTHAVRRVTKSTAL